MPTDLERQALNFLREHRKNAYYASEIIEAIFPNEGMLLFVYGFQSSLLSAMLAPLLEAAAVRGDIEAAWVRTPNAPILPQRYYRAK